MVQLLGAWNTFFSWKYTDVPAISLLDKTFFHLKYSLIKLFSFPPKPSPTPITITIVMFFSPNNNYNYTSYVVETENYFSFWLVKILLLRFLSLLQMLINLHYIYLMLPGFLTWNPFVFGVDLSPFEYIFLCHLSCFSAVSWIADCKKAWIARFCMTN